MKIENKVFFVLAVLAVVSLSGCTTPKEEAYNEGYYDGYDDAMYEVDYESRSYSAGYDEGYVHCQGGSERQY